MLYLSLTNRHPSSSNLESGPTVIVLIVVLLISVLSVSCLSDIVLTEEPDLKDSGETSRSFSPTKVYISVTTAYISTKISNGGLTTSGSFIVKFYVSSDQTINDSDSYIGSKSMPGIVTGGIADCDWRGIFPSDISAGNYYVGWIIDADNEVEEFNESNNTAYISSEQITIKSSDVDPPSNPSVLINGGDSTTDSITATLSLSAEDNVGVTAYFASEDSSTPLSSDSGWKSVESSKDYSDDVIFELSTEEEEKTVYVWFKDLANNISHSSNDNITYYQPPGIPDCILDSSTDGILGNCKLL